MIQTHACFQCSLDQNLGRDKGRGKTGAQLLSCLPKTSLCTIDIDVKIQFSYHFLDTNKSRATSTLNLQSFKWYLLSHPSSTVMSLKCVTSVKGKEQGPLALKGPNKAEKRTHQSGLPFKIKCIKFEVSVEGVYFFNNLLELKIYSE